MVCGIELVATTFYGFMGGETDQWTPFLFRDHSQVFPWENKPGYNFTTDMADDAIKYVKELDVAAPDKVAGRYLGDHAEAHGVVVAPGDQRRPRWRAERSGAELRVTEPCLGNAVHCRRRDDAAKGTRNAIALVIGHDEKNVWGRPWAAPP